jgi:large subunit ribosomal protein L18
MGVTDYRGRKKAVASHRILLVVRFSGKNVSAQFVRPDVKGDEVLSSVHSHSLRKLKWSGSLKSVPACYLLGLLAGKKAVEKGVKDAVLYNGLNPFIKGSRVAAFVKGARDGGVQIPVSEDVLPPEGRLRGETIAMYASSMMNKDKEAYQRRFSSMLRGGFKPEEYPAQFERAKQAIQGGSRR